MLAHELVDPTCDVGVEAVMEEHVRPGSEERQHAGGVADDAGRGVIAVDQDQVERPAGESAGLR